MDLIWLILLVWGITALFSKNREKDKKSLKQPYPPMAAGKAVEKGGQGAKPEAPRPPRQTTVQELMDEAQKLRPKGGEALAPASRRELRPQVHAHTAPGGPAHDAKGSMAFAPTEGVDPCHEDQLPDVNKERPAFLEPEERPGLSLAWTGDAMVKSFVMSEVLARPCERRGGARRPGGR